MLETKTQEEQEREQGQFTFFEGNMQRAGGILKDTNPQDLWYPVREAQVPNTIQEKI